MARLEESSVLATLRRRCGSGTTLTGVLEIERRAPAPRGDVLRRGAWHHHDMDAEEPRKPLAQGFTVPDEYDPDVLRSHEEDEDDE